jgi:cytoskeletal protein CcmA (bactofilin family)
MFSNKNKNDMVKKGGTANGSGSHQLNSLVKDTRIEGKIVSESDIRIDGFLKGTLECKAKVIIGPTGHISGDVVCQSAVIEGKFEGELSVSDVLNVRETAEVSGDVTTQKLIVQSGALFNVSCVMGGSHREKSPAGKKKSQAYHVAEKAKDLQEEVR